MTPSRFKLETYALGGRRSIQLSYEAAFYASDNKYQRKLFFFYKVLFFCCYWRIGRVELQISTKEISTAIVQFFNLVLA